MGTSVYTSLLIKDYKRKLGEIKAMRKELRDMVHLVLTKEQELKSIGIVIRTKEPSLDLNTIKSNELMNEQPTTESRRKQYAK